MNRNSLFAKLNEGVLAGLSAVASQTGNWDKLKEPLRQALNTSLQSSIEEGRKWFKDLPPLGEAHLWAAYVQQKSPNLAKSLLRAAAIAQNPYREWLGIRVLRLTPTEVRALMLRPLKIEGNSLDGGGLLTLANAVGEAFWKQFVDLKGMTLCAKEQTVRILRAEAEGPLRAQLNLPEGERESLFFQLRADGRVGLPTHVDILDSRDLIVAEVEWLWHVERPPYLTGRTGVDPEPSDLGENHQEEA